MRRKHTKSFVILNMLIFLFIAPVLGTWLIITNKSKLTDMDLVATNQGFFINPIIPIASLPIATANGPLFNTAELHGKWILLYFNTEACSENSCTLHLTDMSQIQQSLGKDQHRLIRMWLTHSAIPQPPCDSHDKQLTMAQIKQADTLQPNHFYIVDPFGNLILSYADNTSPQSILNDLQQLMRISPIG